MFVWRRLLMDEKQKTSNICHICFKNDLFQHLIDYENSWKLIFCWFNVLILITAALLKSKWKQVKCHLKIKMSVEADRADRDQNKIRNVIWRHKHWELYEMLLIRPDLLSIIYITIDLLIWHSVTLILHKTLLSLFWELKTFVLLNISPDGGRLKEKPE